MSRDYSRATTLWQIQRWDADAVKWVCRRTGLVEPQGHHFHRAGVRPYSVTEHRGNAFLAAGWTRILNLMTDQGGGLQAWDDTHTRIGVGDGETAVTTADTTLTGSSNKFFKLVSGAGSIGDGAGPPTKTLAFSATFATDEGNFDWKKFGIDQGDSDGATEVAPLLNAALSDQGTKVNGQVWTATATLSFT